MTTLLALFETNGIVDTITSVIGGLLYPLFSIIFVLINAIQNLFYAFAGIDKGLRFDGTPISGENTGAENDTGIVYYLMQNNLVRNMLFSIMLLALFLIIIFTVMAFIKNVYAPKPKKWEEIIGSAIKGLANFVILPVCCLLGVWLGNILLQAINGATSYGGSTTMSRKLFIACSYNANLFRCSENAYGITYGSLEALANNTMISDSSKTFAQYHGLSFSDKDANAEVVNKDSSAEDREYYANLVDQIFSETNVSLHAWGVHADYMTADEIGVGNFYSLWQINYLVLIVGGIFMLYVLGSLTFAMIRRLFLILALFIISPGVCALYPLDDGKQVGAWKSKFIEQVLSAYGAVAGLNIFFSLVPLIEKIELDKWLGGWGMAEIMQIFIFVTGLLIVKELMSLITGFVGGEDAYSKGSSLMKATTGAMKDKFGANVKKGVGVFSKAASNVKHYGFGKGTAKNLGNTLNWAGTKMFGLNVQDDLIKNAKDSWKGVGDAYKKEKQDAENKALVDEFKKMWSEAQTKGILVKTGEDGKKTWSAEGMAKFMKEASYYGVEDAKAYDMLQKNLKEQGVEMSRPDIKREIAKYNKQQEEEKMQRMAAYNAHGKEYEGKLDANIVNIKSAESKVHTAEANLHVAEGSAEFTKGKAEMNKALDDARRSAGRSGGKKGDTQQARNKAIKEMERIIADGDTVSTLDPSKFTGAFKDAVAEFNKNLAAASDSIKKVAEASEEVSAAEREKLAAQKELRDTISEIESEFGDLSGKISDLDKVTEKTSDELAEMVKGIKTEIRK